MCWVLQVSCVCVWCVIFCNIVDFCSPAQGNMLRMWTGFCCQSKDQEAVNVTTKLIGSLSLINVICAESQLGSKICYWSLTCLTQCRTTESYVTNPLPFASSRTMRSQTMRGTIDQVTLFPENIEFAFDHLVRYLGSISGFEICCWRSFPWRTAV